MALVDEAVGNLLPPQKRVHDPFALDLHTAGSVPLLGVRRGRGHDELKGGRGHLRGNKRRDQQTSIAGDDFVCNYRKKDTTVTGRNPPGSSLVPTWILPGVQVLSILDAVFIVSPKSENLGNTVPTNPLHRQDRGYEIQQRIR